MALVTGGSRGIGLATARALAAAGWPVAVASRSEAAAAAAAAAAAGVGVPLALDVTDAAAVPAAVDRAAEALGGLRVLVNCAGVTLNKLLLRQDEASLRAVLDTNLVGPTLVCRAAAKHMLREGGSIVNVGSVVGARGQAGQAAYAASKAGLAGLTRSLAKELGPRGVRVNMVEPGFVETDMTADLPEARREAIRASTALGRFGRPEDVAAVIAFLASDSAGLLPV